MIRALDQWQQSIKSAYDDATRRPQPGPFLQEVLLACALAEVDELRYFTVGAVREPLRRMTGRDYEITNFASDMKDLSEPVRGRILQRVEETFRLRYKITNPIMRPYIVMRGIKEKLIQKDLLDAATSDQGHAEAAKNLTGA